MDSIAARVRSFRHAIVGILYLLRTEPNARVHLIATGMVIAGAILLRVSVTDWLFLILAIAGVWTAEAFNSAIEQLCDHVTVERHESIRRTKDLAAGAVLIASLGAFIIGGIIFIPYLLHLLQK